MPDLFWQQSLRSFTYDALADFIADDIAEGDHLEYKLPKYNQNGKVEFDEKFLETVVAYANTGEGLIIVGVSDKREERLSEIKGINPFNLKGMANPDPARSFQNACQSRIRPHISLETEVVKIPEGEPNAGNLILLVRVRRGLLPPYSLDDRMIYVRNGEDDRLATVREIEALFTYREGAEGHQLAPWDLLRRTVFGAEHSVSAGSAPYAMIGLTPVFPIEPVSVDEDTDSTFEGICIGLGFDARHRLIRDVNGATYAPSLIPQGRRDDPTYATYYNDGSIGIGRYLGDNPKRPISETWLKLRLDYVWRIFRELLEAAETWPREYCKYRGPILCRIAIGSLDNVVAVEPGGGDAIGYLAGTLVANQMPSWSTQFEWDTATEIDSLLGQYLGSLARQLQFPLYRTYREMILAASRMT